MGQRANLIVVEYGEYELFYTHWAANTLPSDLFWSPELATAFIQAQRKVDESGWLDDVWAEGGAVIDWDHKVFLLFGGEDMLWDVPLRRYYLQLLGYVWQGWDIRWAYEGIADIADYVNYPRRKVIRDYEKEYFVKENYEYDLSPPEDKSWTDIVGSVIFNDQSLGLFPLESDLQYLLESGLQLANKINRQKSLCLDHIFLDEWTKEFPQGGFHLDFSTSTLEFWMASDAIDIKKVVTRNWSGWNVIFYNDYFEFQLEKTKNKLRFPLPSSQDLEQIIKDILLKEDRQSPVDGLLEITEKERQEGHTVEINPWALRDNHLVLNIERRKQILDSALAKIKSE